MCEAVRKAVASEKGECARLFLKTLRDTGNFSPITQSVHLGPWPKSEYFRQYKEKHSDGVSLQYFLLLWKTLFPEMRVIKQQRMSPCLICSAIKDKIALLDRKETTKIQALRMELKAHCDDAHEERESYHETRKYAREHPQ